MLFSDIQKSFFAGLFEPFTGEVLFDQIPDVVFFIKNAEGQYIVVNQSLADRCGLKDKKEIIGKTSDEVYPSPLGQEYRRQDEDLILNDKPLLNELELQLNSFCNPCWCLTTKVPLHSSDGGVAGLVGISKDIVVADKKNKDFSQIAQAVSFIQSNYSESLKIDYLAGLTELSVYQFEARMHTIFNLTAGQYIQKVRIDAAIWKLSKTDNSIVQIAMDCGYADQSALSRQFKQAVGVSPGQYRKMAKKENKLSS